MHVRELGILERQGALPAPPQALIEAGDEFDIEYESEATSMQREAEANRVRVWFKDLEYIKQATGDPTVGLLANGQEAGRWMGNARGIPSEIISTKKEINEQMSAMAEAQKEDQAAERLPGEARAEKDLAQAEAAAR